MSLRERARLRLPFLRRNDPGRVSYCWCGAAFFELVDGSRLDFGPYWCGFKREHEHPDERRTVTGRYWELTSRAVQPNRDEPEPARPVERKPAPVPVSPTASNGAERRRAEIRRALARY